MYVYTWGKTTAATIYQQQQHILIFTTKKNQQWFIYVCMFYNERFKVDWFGLLQEISWKESYFYVVLIILKHTQQAHNYITVFLCLC